MFPGASERRDLPAPCTPGQSWIVVLRLEMVINDPTEFKIRKKVWRNGKSVMEWVDMRKGVAYLFRYREVSWAANGRYLDALAEVDDPTDAIQTLDRIRLESRWLRKEQSRPSIPSHERTINFFRSC